VTGPTCRSESLAVAEPLGGTAPSASRLLIVEEPGPWGANAVQDCRMEAALKAQLEEIAKTTDTKLFLARRRDRKRLDGLRNVWFMQRTGRNVAAAHRQVPEDAPIALPNLSASEESRAANPPAGSEHLHPTLFVCTNGARDQCCAVVGRDLLKRLSAETWEISHLGGHRFAPTALRFPDGLLYGRLTVSSALGIMSGDATRLVDTRGRFGRDPWQQVAELSVAAKTGLRLPELDSSGEPGSTLVSDSTGTTWELTMSQRTLAPRRVSCDKTPLTDRAWVGTRMPLP
jgi:hypothetical protein